MTARRRHSVLPRLRKKYSCVMHPMKEICFVTDTKLSIVLGSVTVTYQISRKDKLLRKKYMGEWRLQFVQTVTMMIIFSAKTKRYAMRKIAKKRICK